MSCRVEVGFVWPHYSCLFEAGLEDLIEPNVFDHQMFTMKGHFLLRVLLLLLLFFLCWNVTTYIGLWFSYNRRFSWV